MDKPRIVIITDGYDVSLHLQTMMYAAATHFHRDVVCVDYEALNTEGENNITIDSLPEYARIPMEMPLHELQKRERFDRDEEAVEGNTFYDPDDTRKGWRQRHAVDNRIFRDHPKSPGKQNRR